MAAAENKEFDFEELAKLSRSHGFKYFSKINEALSADTKRCMAESLRSKQESELANPMTPAAYAELGFWYRNLARSLVTYVEGLLFVMRRLIIFAEERGDLKLSHGEGVLIRELSYSVNVARKKIEERESHNRLLENFVISMRLFPQVFWSNYSVDYGDHGWESFQKLVKMRNSLTHPKSFEETLLAPEMPNILSKAAAWIFTCFRDLIGSADTTKLDEDYRRSTQLPEFQSLVQRLRSRPGS